MINLSECEKVMTDLQGVRDLLDIQLRTAADAVSRLEADHAEAATVATHLEGVHSAAMASLDASKTKIVSHVDECRRMDEKIAHWQAMVDDLDRRASGIGKASAPMASPQRLGTAGTAETSRYLSSSTSRATGCGVQRSGGANWVPRTTSWSGRKRRPCP